MSTMPPPPHEEGDVSPTTVPVESPPQAKTEAEAETEVVTAGPDRISPAIMIGIFVILLLCVALSLAAYQGA
jgi:hypothetical protein